MTQQDIRTAFSHVSKPLHKANGLPNECYISDSFYQEERKKIFYQGWFAAGLISDVPEKGDVMPKMIAGFPLLLTRNLEGVVNVFHNVCRHRGHILVSEPGNMPLLRCPYHSWCYSHDGALKKTPHIGGPGQDSHPDFSTGDKGLFRVRYAEWMGVIFVNPSGDAEDFSDYIKQAGDFWHEFTDRKLYGHKDNYFQFEADCNWKFAVENYCEAYHLPWVHPTLNTYSRLEDHYNIEAESCSGQGTLVYRPILDDKQGLRFPPLDDLDKKWDSGAEYLAIYPNLLYGVHNDHCFALIINPQSAECSHEEGMIFYFSEEACDAQHQTLRRRLLENWHQVFAEDISVIEGMQKGRHASCFDGGSFSPALDGASHCFHKWVSNVMTKA